ncbi:MAG: GTP-binding protein [Janthinobacterium lividum]
MPSTSRKIVVTGPYGAGKTTFAATLAAGQPGASVVTTETGVSDETVVLKASTTVAMDHTTVDVDPPMNAGWARTRVGLFGTPGQDRFRFMWELLAQNMDGYVVLVDASRGASIAQAAEIVTAFSKIAPAAPRLVGVNRWDDPGGTRTRLAHLLGTAPQALVACDPRDLGGCTSVLQILLDGVWTLEARRFAATSHGPGEGVIP